MTQPFSGFTQTPEQLKQFALGGRPRTPPPKYYEDGTPIQPESVAHGRQPVAPTSSIPSLPPFQQIVNQNNALAVPEESIPGNPSEALDDIDEDSASYAWQRTLRPTPKLGGAPGTPMFGLQPAPVGGMGNILAATDKAAANLNAARQGAANVQEEKGNAIVKSYSDQQANDRSELARLTDQRNQRQAEMMQKLQDYDRAAQQYTNDLSDNGKYWKNPGNIISAIGAAIIAYASPHDPGIGIRLINQAVAADLNQRKAAADMKLGALRSNIDAYRQIFGDKDLGDMYAYSEAKRIAAMDIQKIASGFVGKEARARAEELAALTNKESIMTKMDIFSKLTVQPQVMNPVIAKLHTDAGFQSYANAANKQLEQATGSAAPTGPQRGDVMADQERFGESSNASPPRIGVRPITGGDASLPGPTEQKTAILPAAKALVRANGNSAKRIDEKLSGTMGTDLAILNKRVPGMAQRVLMYKDNVVSRALPGSRSQQELDAKVNKIIDEDIASAHKVAEGGFQKGFYEQRGWGRFQNELNKVEAAARAHGIQAENIRSWVQETPGLGSIRDEVEKARRAFASTHTDADKEAYENMLAAQRFQQLLNGNVVKYYHDMFGGSMSENEIGLGRGVIDNESDFFKIKGFANQRMTAAGDMAKGYYAQATDGGRQYLQLLYGTNYNVTPNTPAFNTKKKK